MNHVGKVLDVFKSDDNEMKSAENSVQVHIEMWDGNEVIVTVHASLNNEIKIKDIILVRYAQPEPIVIKILKGKRGKDLFEHFQKYFEEKKNASEKKQQVRYSGDDFSLGKMVR